MLKYISMKYLSLLNSWFMNHFLSLSISVCRFITEVGKFAKLWTVEKNCSIFNLEKSIWELANQEVF